MSWVDDAVEILKKVAEASPATVTPTIVHELNGKGGFVALKDGYTLEEISGPEKGQRKHTFHDLKSFANWLNRHVAADEEELVEILATQDVVVAGLYPQDLTADVVSCKLTLHPAAQEWFAIFGQSLDQKKLHAFLRGHKTDIASADMATVLLSELSKLSVVINKDLSANLDERGFLQFQGNTGKTHVGGSIPGDFTIKIPVVMGVLAEGSDNDEQQYTIDVLLSMEVDDKGAQFSLSAPGLTVVKHQARLDAIAYLERLLRDGFLVGLGDYLAPAVPMVRLFADDGGTD